MQARIFVNADKEWQDIGLAMLANINDIVKVQYNESEKRVEFFHNKGYLGSTSSNERVEGYVQVKNIEYMRKGYHFTLAYYEGLSKTELIEKIQIDVIEENRIKEEIKQEKERERREREIEKELAKEKEKVKKEAEVFNSFLFTELVKKYYFSKRSGSDSLVSDVFKVVGSLFFGKPIPTAEESAQNWWRNELQKSLHNNFAGKYLYELNESGKLLPIVKKYEEKYAERERVQQKSQQLLYLSQHGRFTHCWRCRSTLTSETHSKCRSCKWLICSCGACKKGCSTY